MLVAPRAAVGEGDASAVVPADPQAGHLRLGLLELVDELEVAQLVLGDRRRPQLEAEHLGWG